MPKKPARQQTDESLRVERARADDAISEQLAAIEETADEITNRARERADEVLAVARARTDQHRPLEPVVAAERRVADRTLRDERADADEVLRAERAEHVDVLASERRDTDDRLVTERAGSDTALATRDEFLGIVSHDLRNMLAAIVGFAGAITQAVAQPDHDEMILSHARRIQRSSGRMNRLIGDLVDVASIEAGSLAVNRERCDVASIITEAVETFQTHAAANNVALSAETVGTPPSASLDAARLLQVVINLVSNAIKFTPAGGSVVVRLQGHADHLAITVTDTGSGIPADRLEAIFERFVQVDKHDRRGVGLGLYISKCIVQGHGGRIWAESTLGKGSTFRVTIPTT
jgi:signal transduction histidine kinase